MLIFKEMTEDLNIIHMVYGDETELQLDISGHLIIDLDDKLEKNKKNILYINRCRSEELVHDNLDLIMGKIGFRIPVVDKHKHSSKPNPPKINDDKLANINKDIKCPQCLEFGCIIVDGIPGMCPSCELINLGLDKNLSPKKKKRTKKKRDTSNDK